MDIKSARHAPNLNRWEPHTNNQSRNLAERLNRETIGGNVVIWLPNGQPSPVDKSVTTYDAAERRTRLRREDRDYDLLNLVQNREIDKVFLILDTDYRAVLYKAIYSVFPPDTIAPESCDTLYSEILAEVITSLYYRKTYKPGGSFISWLFKISQNTAKKAIRDGTCDGIEKRYQLRGQYEFDEQQRNGHCFDRSFLELESAEEHFWRYLDRQKERSPELVRPTKIGFAYALQFGDWPSWKYISRAIGIHPNTARMRVKRLRNRYKKTICGRQDRQMLLDLICRDPGPNGLGLGGSCAGIAPNPDEREWR